LLADEKVYDEIYEELRYNYLRLRANMIQNRVLVCCEKNLFKETYHTRVIIGFKNVFFIEWD